MRAVVVAVALLGLLAVACAEEKQQKDPNKYGWDNYGYTEDGYAYEKYPKGAYGGHRKYIGNAPYSKSYQNSGYAAHQEGAQQEVTPQGELEGAQQLLNMPTQQPQTVPAQQPLTVTPEQPQAVAPQQPQTVTPQQPQTVPAQQPQP